MEIRKARHADAEDIAAHNMELAQETEHISLSRETALRGVRAILDDPAKGFYLVAVHEERIVGQLMVTYEWSDWRARPIWWLQSVYVTPSWRQRRVFARLLETLRSMADQRHVCELRLYVHQGNQAACRAYRRLGFTRLPYQMYGTEI